MPSDAPGFDPSFTERGDFPPLGALAFDRRSRREVEFIFREIFVDEEYLRHGITLAPGATVIDAGANIGLFSLFAARACGGDLRLLAFEPAPATYGYLVENLRAHGLLGRPGVEVSALGLGRIGGPATASMTFYPGMPGNSTLHGALKAQELARHREVFLKTLAADNPGMPAFIAEGIAHELDVLAQGVEIPIALTTLTDVIHTRAIERVELLKVDVEGAELDVLAGLDAATWPRIAQVVLETTTPHVDEVERVLREGGLDVVLDVPVWAERMGLANVNVYARRAGLAR
ncbi:FkbM family methyltransferase [Myxococcota bacterium]|nr:FkbM family methyltransferase [Myxococcota bacterium]